MTDDRICRFLVNYLFKNLGFKIDGKFKQTLQTEIQKALFFSLKENFSPAAATLSGMIMHF